MKIKTLIVASILLASTSFSETTLAPKQTIFCQGENGELFTIGKGSLERKYLSNHTPFYIPTFKVSPDFRYILHGGNVKAIGRQKFFLYDLKNSTEKFMFETPIYVSMQEEFSPDSKTLALLKVGNKIHKQALKDEGLYLIDLETLEQSFFPYPDDAELPHRGATGGTIRWSKDGTSIYLAFQGYVKSLFREKFIREYHRFDITEKKFYKANGYYEGDLEIPTKSVLKDYVFTDEKGSIPVHENLRPRSHRGGKNNSPDGRWTAEVENKQTLVISEKGGRKITVDESERCVCGACTIGGLNWLDDGRLLIYRTDELGYCIYNPITEEKGVLFKSRDIEAFTWQ